MNSALVWSADGNSGSAVQPAAQGTCDVNNTIIPMLAYLIMGSEKDAALIPRLLLALYHPHNEYLIYLEGSTLEIDHSRIKDVIESQEQFKEQKNVQIVRGGRGTYRGVTMLSILLHGAAILLKGERKWDWMVVMSGSDYPLYSQTDVLAAMATIPRNLNFMSRFDTNSEVFDHRFRHVYLDPILHGEVGELFHSRSRRRKPVNFKPVYGSAWVTVTRDFVEYCVMGYEHFPRTALLYFSNAASVPEAYFQTVACNTRF